MPTVPSAFASSRDRGLAAQLAEHATSATPAWLWAANGSQILWTNAVGAAIFGAANPGDCATRRFDNKHPAALEIGRLAATLPAGGQARLERLRGFGANFGGALTCLCARAAANDESASVLIVAAEPAGPALTLRERVSRLFSHRDEPLAVFMPDGSLLYATTAAQAWLGGAATVGTLGIADGVSQALSGGRASGSVRNVAVSLERLGSDASTVIVAYFGAQNGEALGPKRFAMGSESAFAPAAQQTGSGPRPGPSPRGAAHDQPFAERRHPLRFVWQMDAAGHFVIGSDEFIELMGPRTTAAFGRLWSEIASELSLDPQNQVAQAVASRETWSGITASWPVNEGSERLPVELSGLPVFGQGRDFRGYRGFGVCRDIARINQLVRARREHPIGFMTQPAALLPERADLVTPTSQGAPPTDWEAVATAAPSGMAEGSAPRTERLVSGGAIAAANVVPFRSAASAEPKAPALSPVEHKAFRELAQELTARLQGDRQPSLSDVGTAEAKPAEIGLTPSEPKQKDSQETQILPSFATALLDRIPLSVLIYRNDTLLYANRHFLDLGGYQSLDALAAAGGLNTLFVEPDAGALAGGRGAQRLAVATSDGEHRAVEGWLFTVPWDEASALALVLTNDETEERRPAAAENEIRELKAKLDSYKHSEDELGTATREVQKAVAAKTEFVAKISHEIRTPLNTIIGFAEVIMAERFGPIGNERYREYLKDIHAAGLHVVSLLNDLLDLSKIETGQLDLAFANVSLNELTQQCVGIMQPQASRARIIIRTSLTPRLPRVVADERSLRQIVLNLLSNSIKFTGPGGQVIISTAFADSGEAVLRVRDTGVGMSDKDVEAVLEPFRQTATSGTWGSGGTSLGLPLTKALAEANRAHFSIKSAPNAGTLVEVAFPPTRVVAR